jgi:hypothetical protein
LYRTRKRQYWLARAAAKYGPQIESRDLIEHLAGARAYWRRRHPYRKRCGAYFVTWALGGCQIFRQVLRCQKRRSADLLLMQLG